LPLNGFEFLAVAFLAGVGFTVSLLISNLAFKDMPDVLADATLGVIAGSLISMALGAIIARLQGSARLEAKKAKKQEKSQS
jgi:NhaA family Na+:H+ antiporter